MRSGATRTVLIALIASALSAAIALTVWLIPAVPQDAAQANHLVALGIDADTTGNSALSLGPATQCTTAC